MATAVPEEIADAEDEAPVAMRKAPKTDDEMDITPMIDCTFLLLIFFLVASKMNPEPIIDLAKARHGGSIVATESVILLVKKGSGDTALVESLDGTTFTSSDPGLQEDEIAAYVEAGMSGAPPFKQPMKYLLIKAEREVKTGEVSRIKQAAEKAAGEGVRVFMGVKQE